MAVFTLSDQAFRGYLSTFTYTPRVIQYTDVADFFELHHQHLYDLLTVAQRLMNRLR